jgi:hypothetical protein
MALTSGVEKVFVGFCHAQLNLIWFSLLLAFD